MSEELGSKLRMGIDTKIEKDLRQQLDALLPAVLKSKIQASLHVAQADWIASLDKLVADTKGEMAVTVPSPLLWNLQVSVEKSLSDQIKGLFDSQPLDTTFLINVVRAQMYLALPFHPHSFPYENSPEIPSGEHNERPIEKTQPGYERQPIPRFTDRKGEEQIISGRKAS